MYRIHRKPGQSFNIGHHIRIHFVGKRKGHGHSFSFEIDAPGLRVQLAEFGEPIAPAPALNQATPKGR